MCFPNVSCIDPTTINVLRSDANAAESSSIAVGTEEHAITVCGPYTAVELDSGTSGKGNEGDDQCIKVAGRLVDENNQTMNTIGNTIPYSLDCET